MNFRTGIRMTESIKVFRPHFEDDLRTINAGHLHFTRFSDENPKIVLAI